MSDNDLISREAALRTVPEPSCGGRCDHDTCYDRRGIIGALRALPAAPSALSRAESRLARAVVERDDADSDERILTGSPRTRARANHARDEYDLALVAYRAALAALAARGEE